MGADILQVLARQARIRVEKAKTQLSADALHAQALALPADGTFPFERALRVPELSFICEVKRASPSRGLIAPVFPYREIARDYERAGASAVSVLTEPEYFLGDDKYLREIAEDIGIPVLRKDFTVDVYQLDEAKRLGASAVLLICAILEERELRDAITRCDALGLSALVEAHDACEMKMALAAGARVIAVNNRSLRTFEVDMQNAARLRALAPENVLFVAESGVKTRQDIITLEKIGADAVLIGETLMSSSDRRGTLCMLRGDLD